MSQTRRRVTQIPLDPEEDPLNRRRENRFPVAIKASVCLLGDLTGERAEINHAYVHDLSRGGLRLTTYAPVHKGEEILVKFASPGSGARTRRVQVFWVEELSPGRFHVGAGAAEDSESAIPRPPEGKPRGRLLHLSADPLAPEGEADTPESGPHPSAREEPEGEQAVVEEKEEPIQQVTHVTLQTNRGPLDSAAILILALAFLTSMALMVVWQWYQIQ